MNFLPRVSKVSENNNSRLSSFLEMPNKSLNSSRKSSIITILSDKNNKSKFNK